MPRFFLKAFLLLFPFLLIALLLPPNKIDKGLRKTKFARNYVEWNDIFDSKINADLIIQGNSRAWVHISPAAIDSAFNLNSYNLGIDGYSFHMQYYRFLVYIKYNKKPRYIIQSTDQSTFNKEKDLYEYEQFIPFLNDKIIREAVLSYNGLDYKDLNIPFYKYFHNMRMYLKGLKFYLFNSPQQTNGKFKGFKSQNKPWDNSFENFRSMNPNGYSPHIDSTTLNLFDSFVKYCTKENIRLIFVNTPTFYKATKMLNNKKTIDSIYETYSKTYNIPYLNYSNDSICFDSSNFYNSQHLNTTGVNKFNLKLVNDLKKYLTDKSN